MKKEAPNDREGEGRIKRRVSSSRLIQNHDRLLKIISTMLGGSQGLIPVLACQRQVGFGWVCYLLAPLRRFTVQGFWACPGAF